MLKFFALTLLALHCNCQRIFEVRNGQVIRNDVSHVSHVSPVKTVSGLSPIGLSEVSPLSYSVPSYMSSLPVVSYGSYGGYLSDLNSGYLSSARNVYGGISLAPSVYSVAPQHKVLAIRQPTVQTIIAQPVHRPVVQTLAISQPTAVEIARPHVFSAAIHSDAVRPVSAAIHQIGRTVEYKEVGHNEHPAVPQDVVVEPSDQPLNIHFRSRSSTVKLTQDHIPGEPGTVEQTQSQDEPSKVIHEVVKPVIQEVREVIQPYRQVTQEVQPVVENVHRIVSSGQSRQQYVQEPVVKQVAVKQPVSFAVAKPAITVEQQLPITYHAQRAVASPIQYQTVSNDFQPIISSIIRTPIVQRLGQPIINYNRVITEQIPAITEVREVRPDIRIRQVVRDDRKVDRSFVKFVETE